jgi:hypothetical protein
MKLYLQSTLDPGIRFEILAFNPETKQGQVRSVRYASEFPVDLTKENLIKLNYRIVKEEADHAVQ